MTDGPLAAFASNWGVDQASIAMRRACRVLVDDLNLHAFPRSLTRVCEALGASVVSDAGLRGGALQVDDSDFVIRLGQGHWRRRRWTLAHEIGHLLVLQGVQDDGEALQSLARGEDYHAVEALCDIAAAELLCPSTDLRHRLRDDLTSELLLSLYDRYLVSWTAVIARVAEDYPHASASLWDRAQQHGGFTLLSQYGGWRVHEFPHSVTAPGEVNPDLLDFAATRGHAAGPLSYMRNDVSMCLPAIAVRMPTRPSSRLPLWGSYAVADERTRPGAVVVFLVDGSLGQDLMTVRDPTCVPA